jgi:hypothetical protein
MHPSDSASDARQAVSDGAEQAADLGPDSGDSDYTNHCDQTNEQAIFNQCGPPLVTAEAIDKKEHVRLPTLAASNHDSPCAKSRSIKLHDQNES